MNNEQKKSPWIRFFGGPALPLLLLSATLVYEAFLLAIVFAPDSTSAWGGFAREFKQWCFDYDSKTGGMDWAQAGVMLIEPLFISGIAAFLWRKSLGQLATLRAWFGQWPTIGAGLVIASVVIVGLFVVGQPAADADAPLPFPGERIRTSLIPPSLSFVDQKGNPFNLAAEQGRVVLITGVYAACSSTCPQILLETKALLESLPEESLARLDVVVLSLDPEYDTASMMDRIATGYGFNYPQFRYLNGDPEILNDSLTRLGFSKSVDPETGVINHANLFLVVDGEGRIAYRFALDARHRQWLREAVLALTNEAGTAELAAHVW